MSMTWANKAFGYKRSWQSGEQGGAGFTPTDISGLVLWLKSDAGVYTDTAGNTPASNDGDSVNCWSDQSGNNNHAISSSSSNTDPVIKLNIQNGKPVVRFSGTSTQRLVIPDANNLDCTTITQIGVVKVTNDALGGDINTGFFLKSGNTSAADGIYGLTLLKSSAGVAKNGVFFNANPGGWNDRALGSGNINYGTFYLIEQVFDGTTAISYTNASQAGSTSITATINTSTGSMTIGGINAFAVTTRIRADIGELLIYNSALSTTDRQKVETYLNSRWALY